MKTRAFIFIILAGVTWGTSGIFVHYLAPLGFTSLQMTSARAVVSFVSIALYALLCNRSLFRVKARELVLYAFIGAAVYFTASCYFTSIQLTTVSTAVVLMYAAPVYVSIGSVLLFGERFTPFKILAVFCMIVGCCLVSGLIGNAKFNGIGIVNGVLAGVAFAAYNLLSKLASRKNCNPMSVVMYSFLFMSLLSCLFSSPVDLVLVAAQKPWPSVPLLLSLGIVTCVLPYFLYNVAMRQIPVGTASALGIVEPMSATLFGVFLFDEALSVFGIIGIVLILFAVGLLGYTDGRERVNKTD